MGISLRYILPALLLAAGLVLAWGFAGAQPREVRPGERPMPPQDRPPPPPSPQVPAYVFDRGEEITSGAEDLVIEPALNALADDRFQYEVYVNASREGITRDGDKVLDAYHRTENWINWISVVAEEDPLEGNTDLLWRIWFDQMAFKLDLGDATYTGAIMPNNPQTGRGAIFHEIQRDGTRNEVNNIPGWPGITARNVEGARHTQSMPNMAAAWFSVDDTGRVYNPTYFANFETGDQVNYPGRMQDPVHIASGLMPRYAEDASLKIGDSMTVRRGFPLGVTGGALSEYEFTYTLERLYGTIERPTAARFRFDAKPLAPEQTVSVHGLTTRFTAPEITGGDMLVDLEKGVAAYIAWEYALEGTVSESDTGLVTGFEVKTDFSASLREQDDAEQ